MCIQFVEEFQTTFLHLRLDLCPLPILRFRIKRRIAWRFSQQFSQ
jgi:hypothetical protein